MTKRLKNLIVGVIIGVILIAAGLITGIILINNANKNAPTYVSTAAELEKAVNDDIDKPIVLKDNIIINGDFTANKLFDLEMNNYNVTVDGKFTLKTEESGEMYLCDGKNSLFTREVIKAKQIEVDAVNATVVWNANVTLKDGYTADDFKITVSQHTFIFNGIILNEEGTQSPTAMTVAGGRVVVADNSDEGAASESTIVVPKTANSVVIENHGDEAVSVYAGTGVSVAGKVEVSVADEAEGVVISTPENNEIPTNIVIVSGTAESVNADGAEVTVGENAVVTGTVTGDKVTNNGSVGEIVADEVVDNSFSEYKTAKKAEVEQYALDKGESNYSAQNWALIEGYVSAAKTAIDAAEDKAAVDSAVSSAKASIDAVKTIAEEDAEALKAKKTEVIGQLDAAFVEYDEADYRAAEWANIENAYNAAKSGINAVTDISDLPGTFVATFIATADAQKTDAELAAEEAAALNAKKTEVIGQLDAALAEYDEADYRTAQWTNIENAYNTAKNGINAVTDINDLPGTFVATFITTADAQKTDAELTAEEAAEALAAKKTKAKSALESYASEEDYYSAEWEEVLAAIEAGKNAIDEAGDIAAVDEALTAAKAEIDKVATKAEADEAARQAALSAIEEYVASFNKKDYTAEDWTTITGKTEEAKAALNTATKETADGIVAALKEELDAIEVAPVRVEDGIGYATFEEALAVVNEDGTVIVVKDVTVSTVFEVKSGVTVVVSAGAALDGASNVVKVYGTVTVDGTIKNVTFVRYGSGTVTVNGTLGENAALESAYTVTYELNDGENDIANPVEIITGTEYTLNDARKTGYTFDGWFTDPDFAEDTLVTVLNDFNGNVTLYAKFTVISVKVTMIGAAASAETPVSYGSTFEEAFDSGSMFGSPDAWYFKEADGSLTEVKSTDESYYTEDIVLYGGYKEGYALYLAGITQDETGRDSSFMTLYSVTGAEGKFIVPENYVTSGFATSTIPVLAIEKGAFKSVDITEAFIPASVKTLGEALFKESTSVSVYTDATEAVESWGEAWKRGATVNVVYATVLLDADALGSDYVFEETKSYVIDFAGEELYTDVLRNALAASVKSMTINLYTAATRTIKEEIAVNSPAVINGNGAVFSVSSATAFAVNSDKFELYNVNIKGGESTSKGVAINYTGASNVVVKDTVITLRDTAVNACGIGYFGDDATGSALRVENSEIYLGNNYNNDWYNTGDDSRGISLFNQQNGKTKIIDSKLKGFKYVVNVTGKALTDEFRNEYYYGSTDIDVSGSTLYGWTGFNVWSSGVDIALTNGSYVRGINDMTGDTNSFSAITFNGDIYEQFDHTVIKDSTLTIADSTVATFVAENSLATGIREDFIRVDYTYGFTLTLDNAVFVDENKVNVALIDSGTGDFAFIDKVAEATLSNGGTYKVTDKEGNRLDVPIAPVTINRTLIADATAAANSIDAVYNAYVDAGEKTVEEIKADYPDFNFYVALGTTSFLPNYVAMGEWAFASSDTVKISIGNNTFVNDNVWYYDAESKTVYVSVVVLAAEMYTKSSEVHFGGPVYDYPYIVEGKAPALMKTMPAVYGNGGSEITDHREQITGYNVDYTLKDGADAISFSYDGAAAGDIIVTKKVITDSEGAKTVTYGFTHPDAVGEGYGLVYYPKWGATAFDNGSFTVDYSFYVLDKGTVINTVNVTVDVPQYLVSSAEELTNALNNVQTGDVIILQDNIATEGKVTTLRADSRDLDFTLDLNGFAITDRLDLRSTTVDNKESGYKLKVTVKNGTVGSTDESVYYGILLAGGNVDVTLYEVESLGYYGGIYENGSWSGSSVTAEKCAFKGSDTAYGAYLPGGHTSTFTDCIFEGSVGAYVKSGNKTFNNCTITGNGEYIAPSYNGNGADGSGSGLVVDSTVGYQSSMVVTVNGGSISSVNGYAVEEVSNAAEGVDKVCYSTVTLDNVSLSGKIENVYSENGVVKSIEGDKTVSYVSSETAINNVAPYVGDGEYIVLTGDIVSTNESNNLLLHSAYGAKNYTLDLNGHRLNAEVYAMASHSKGDYETLNITIMDSSAEEGKPGKGLIGSDVENMYGIIPQGNSNMTVTLKNLNVTGEWAFYTNGIYSGATITAEDCVFVTNPLDPGFGAYLASNHNVTFTNCTFEGNAGVYIKSGNTIFNNCTIAGNGVYEKPSYNNNGADGSGSGLVVDSTVGYQSPMVVTVNGGTVSSVNGYAVEEVSNAAEGVDKVCYSEVTVKGGTALVSGALGDVYSENGVVTVVDESNAKRVYVGSAAGFENLIKNPTKGMTIVLCDDISGDNTDYNIKNTTNVNMTIDLNGYNLDGELNVINKASGLNYLTLTVKNGTIGSQTGYTAAGGMIWYGIMFEGSGKMTVTLQDIDFVGYYGGYYENGTSNNDETTITVTDCTFKAAKNEEGAYTGYGAYMPGNYTVEFNRCTFEGSVGVYVKSGTRTFTDCTINGVYDKYVVPTYNGNGANGAGSGLIVNSTKGYSKPMVITVTGGSISSASGYAVEELALAAEGESTECYATVSIKNAELSGALGDVYSENGVVTVLCECGVQCVRQLTTLPTATQAGEQKYVCPDCGKVYGGKSVAALPEGGIYASIDGGDFFEIGFVTDFDSERVGDSDIILGLQGKQTLTIYNVPYADAETSLNEGFEFNSAWFEINEGERVMNDDYTYVYDKTVRVDLLEGAADKGASANKAITINLADYPDLSFITYFYDVAKDGGSCLSMGYIEIDMTSSVNVIAAV